SINVLSGLTLDGARDHGDGGGDHARSAAAFLTGAHPRKTNGADIQNGISIDQLIAQKIGEQTRFASLELGLEGSAQSGDCDSGYSCAYSSNLAWRNATSPIGKERDPAAVFDRLFASGEDKSDKKVSQQRRSHRQSVLDFALSDAKDDLSRVLRMAEREQILITRHGKPAGILVGFASEEDWFDWRLENDPRFLQRVAKARSSLRAGRGVPIEELPE
ncbi:MAG: type II toxin-antitoxin system prevent-host-death family antitoxin, partial [Bryobacter sp.]|nr:type II toxin-antitoxin system prevent-host-death family antitoxin [Bryobacter sp.]